MLLCNHKVIYHEQQADHLLDCIGVLLSVVTVANAV